MTAKSFNPATGEDIKEYAMMNNEQVQVILSEVQTASEKWKRTSFEERSKLMNNMAGVLKKNKNQYAELMTKEMGKPITQSRAEVDKCAFVCEFYAQNAKVFLDREVIKTDASLSFASFQPLGAVLAIMPWNFPFWQVFRFLAPALMAGNVGILKHSSNVFGSGLAMENIVKEAGFPPNVFRNLLIRSKDVADVIRHPVIKAVTLTGSTPAGKAVASTAGSVLKKVVLELGGSDAYIVLADADIEKAVETCVASRMINGGQSCVAAKRFIVVQSVKDEFEKLYVEKMKKYVIGDPMDEKTLLGPQARFDLRDELHDQVQRSVKGGAKLLLGGEIPKNKGAYYPATVLSDVKKGIAAYEEELFGPVATIIPVKDEKEAIAVANDSIFGLGSAVFTADVKRGEQIAEKEIEAGACFVNSSVRSDPRLPFGGIKESGYGRELSSYGIREFVNIKTVYVA